MCNINAYSEAIKLFKEKNPGEMAKNAGAAFNKEKDLISLTYMGCPVEVQYPTGEIWSASLPLVKNDKVLILQYLTGSCGAHPKGDWISFIQLPGGPHHHAPFVLEAINPLAETFGERIEEFSELVRSFGADEIEMGDYGVKISVFPLIPMAVCLRRGDEEFQPGANVLFDSNANLHLTTAALWVLGIELSRKLCGIGGQQFS